MGEGADRLRLILQHHTARGLRLLKVIQRAERGVGDPLICALPNNDSRFFFGEKIGGTR